MIVFARHLGHRMYRGEYFAMQVDAHIRFVQDWDTDVISQWVKCQNEMAVLSVYPAGMEYINETTGKVKERTSTLMCDTYFEKNEEDDDSENPIRYLRHGTQDTVDESDKPMIHPFWGAGFSFARGHFVVNVPYDQYLPNVFQGEEISIGLRGFTYGYDYYRPVSFIQTKVVTTAIKYSNK